MQIRSVQLMVMLLAAACVLIAPVMAVEYFVAPAPAGSDGNGGTGWGDAYATIGNAVAQGDATIVSVSNGTYNITSQILVTNGVTIRSFGGGVYGGLLNASNTVVDGPGIGGSSGVRVFKMEHANAVLDGLTITDGSGRGENLNGAGVNMTNGASMVNCIIEGNGVAGDTSYLKGAGVYMVGGMISNCIVRHNRNDQRGGGPGINATDGQIVKCQILSNTNNGGAWTSNGHGGGIYAKNSVIRNCLVAGNVGITGHGNPMGGEIYADGGSIESCTVVNNSSQNGAGGVHLVGGATMINTIVFSNTVSGAHNNLNTMTAVSYSCSTNTGNTTSGNIMASPMFENVAAGDFRLASGSPCIGKGNNQPWMTGALDLAGSSRLKGVVDMGAYEAALAGTVVIIR